MAHRGQRYFEQPLPNTNNDKSPPRKRPAFHEVFGNSRFRTFQQEGHGRGRGRGRLNTRGRGRGNRGFQFNPSRNSSTRDHDRNQYDRNQYDRNHHDRNHHDRNHHDRNHHDRNHHDRNHHDRNHHDRNHHDRNHHDRNHHDKNHHDKNHHDRNHHDRNHHDRNHHDRNHHDRNHHDRNHRDKDPRESGDGYPVNDQQQPLFGPGTKRPAFKPIDFDGRRKKKRVAGGRIKKFERIEEFKGDTYCDVCNEGFRDVNAKALHDRSKAHRRNYGYLRYETMEHKDEDEDIVDLASTNQASDDVRRKNMEKGTAAFLSFKSLPKDFQEWAERSLTVARQAAAESNDPSLLQAVQREIIEVYRVNDENCSLRRVCWTRRELATGSLYRDSSLAPSSLPVIKDSELLTKEKVEVSKKEESNAGQQKSVLSPEKAPRKTHAEAVGVQHHEVPVEVVDEAPPPAPPILHQTPLSEPLVAGTSFVNSTLLPTANLPPYNEMKLKWRLSKAARAMLSCCHTEHKAVVLAKYNDKFGDTTIRDKDPSKEQADGNSKESLITTYRAVRQQFKSEEYEYEDLTERMTKLAKQLKGDTRRVSQLRDVLQMQTKIALQVGEFRDCRQPCSAFVRTFAPPLSVQGRNIDMVGQWFVSILLKERPGSSRRGFPAMLEVAQEMRSFPAGVTEDPWVQESMQAFRCVLGNNWSGFSKRSIEHCQGSPLSQMLEGFIPFMREEALVMLTTMSKKYQATLKESLPPAIPLTDFQRCLAWESSDDIDASLEEVKDFVTSLRYPFEITRDDKDRECIQWRGNSDEELALSEDIDVREDMLSRWRKVRVLEEED